MSKKFWIFIVSTLSIALIVFALIKTTNFATQYRYEQTIKSFQNGDFTRFIESESVNRADLQNAYKVEESQKNNEFVRYDINKDGIDELVWREKDELKGGMKRILGIFVYQENSIKSIFWDVNDSTEFCFLGENGNIVYYTQYYGTYMYEEYNHIAFDADWKMSADYRLEIWNIYSLEEVGENWEDQHPDMANEGIYCKKKFISSADVLNVQEQAISKEEFLTEFIKLTGLEFIDSENSFN